MQGGAAGLRPGGLACHPEPMPGKLRRRAVLAAVLTSLVFAAAWLGAGGASAAAAETSAEAAAALKGGVLVPKGKQVYFGVSDTGDPASFGEFSEAVSKHPAVIESFRAWGSTSATRSSAGRSPAPGR